MLPPDLPVDTSEDLVSTILALPCGVLNQVASHLSSTSKVDFRAAHPSLQRDVVLDRICLVIALGQDGSLSPDLPSRPLPKALYTEICASMDDQHCPSATVPRTHTPVVQRLCAAARFLGDAHSIELRGPTCICVPLLQSLAACLGLGRVEAFTLVTHTPSEDQGDDAASLMEVLRVMPCVRRLALSGLDVDLSACSELHATVPFTSLTLHGPSWRGRMSMGGLRHLHLLVGVGPGSAPVAAQFVYLPRLSQLSLVYTDGVHGQEEDVPVSGEVAMNQVELHNVLLQTVIPLVPTLTSLVVTRAVGMFGWWPPTSFTAATRRAFATLPDLRHLHAAGILTYPAGPLAQFVLPSLRELVCDVMCVTSLDLAPGLTSLTCRLLLNGEDGADLPPSIRTLATEYNVEKLGYVTDLSLALHHCRNAGVDVVQLHLARVFRLSLRLHEGEEEQAMLDKYLAKSLTVGGAPCLRSLTLCGLRGDTLCDNLAGLLRLTQLAGLRLVDCDVTVSAIMTLAGLPLLRWLEVARCRGVELERYRDIERAIAGGTPPTQDGSSSLGDAPFLSLEFRWPSLRLPFVELQWFQ